MDEQLRQLSRKAWSDLEALHVVGYFAPQVTQKYVDLGLDPRLSYFASRSAAFGEAGPGLTVATFYVFAPWLVEAALPGAWKIASPAKLVEARRAGMSDALRDVLGEPEVDEALGIAREVCSHLSPQGRPLYAAHAELPWPEDGLLALWHAATLVREHRGDGHVSVLLTNDVDPVEATVLGGLWSGTTRFLQKTRGWSDEEYAAASRPAARPRLARRRRRPHRHRQVRAAPDRARHGPARARGLGARRRRGDRTAARPGGTAAGEDPGLGRDAEVAASADRRSQEPGIRMTRWSVSAVPTSPLTLIDPRITAVTGLRWPRTSFRN